MYIQVNHRYVPTYHLHKCTCLNHNGKYRQEILNRRVGANELDAIAICRGFVEAQQEYAQQKHDDSKVNQYAQRVISSHRPGDVQAL